MEISIVLLLVSSIMAFIMEYVDSSLGMGYGTVLSPALIIMGFNPLLAVPSILLSQAAGGFTASLFHHRLKNADFRKRSKDSFVVYVIAGSGIAVTVIAAVIAINMPKLYLNTYIGLLVGAMGLILISNVMFRFTWKKIAFVGVLSSFNKGMSGGGFGPVVTGGQVIAGQNQKNAIGCTTLAEAPICIAGFAVFFLINGIANWWLPLALTIGAVAAAPLGALTTRRLDSSKYRRLLGILILALGLWTLLKVWL